MRKWEEGIGVVYEGRHGGPRLLPSVCHAAESLIPEDFFL